MRSLRICDVRKGLKRFSGAVHSFIELPHLGSGSAAFHTFTVPEQLKAVDAEHLDRIIISSQRLLGPVPYRGGGINIDMGLFSVETDDILNAYLGVLTDIANAAGVGYVKAAQPFVKPIEDGVQRLLDASGSIILEIGLSKNLDTPRIGSYVIMRAPSEQLRTVELTHDSEFKLWRGDGGSLDFPYFTFEITASPHRDNWFEIDDLRRAYSTLQDVVRSGNLKGARDQFAVFRNATLTSPDLLFPDAQAIVAKAEQQLEATLTTTTTAAEERLLPDLGTLAPFKASDELTAALERRPSKAPRRGGGSASPRLVAGNGGGGSGAGDAVRESAKVLRPSRGGVRQGVRLARGSSSGKRVNAWVSGRGASRTVPLKVRETYELNINVGVPRRGSVVKGDVEIDTSSFPAEGLETEWILSAKGMELAPGPGETDITIGEGTAKEPWTARYRLHIPKDEDSLTRVLAVTPRRATAGKIDVVILVGAEFWRRLTIVLCVSGHDEERASRGGIAAIKGDFTETLASHTQLQTLHEWTTPPGELSLIVRRPDVIVAGSAGGGLDVNGQSAQWSAAPALVSAPIKAVRAAADAFRARWDAYLNDIPSAEMVQRLHSTPISYWGSIAGWADPAHERTWREARKSNEFRELAYAGRVLYDAVFPSASPLRGWMDSLSPGHRLNITWQNVDPGWVPGVPWGLMYAGDPEKRTLDPLEFLGLKLRIAYSSHVSPAASRALGDPAKATCSNLFYWGSKPSDVTGAEAAWQRGEWSAWKGQLSWPSASDAKEPKKEIVEALARPKPAPVAVLYLYCQSTFGANTRDPVLGFSDPLDAASSLTVMDLGLNPFKDRPLVFANACTTSAGSPYESNPLEDRFFQRECRAFLGTEILVPIEFASRFARVFFEFFYRRVTPDPIAAGEAVAQTRLFLWYHYRNIGGLFYTYVNQYDLFMGSDAEIGAMRR